MVFCCFVFVSQGRRGGRYDYWGSVDALFYFEKVVECGRNTVLKCLRGRKFVYTTYSSVFLFF